MTRHSYHILCIVFFICSGSFLFGQTIEKNSTGNTIITYPDGSWRYFDENRIEDQQLMQAYLNKIDAVDTPKTTEPTPLDVDEDSSSASTNISLNRLISNALEKEQKALNDYYSAKELTLTVLSNYKKIRKNKNSSDAVINRAKLDYEITKGKEKKAKRDWELATKTSKDLEKIALMPVDQQSKALKKLGLDNTNPSYSANPSTDDLALVEPKIKAKNKKTKVKKQRKKKVKKSKNKVAKVKKQKKQKVKKQKESIAQQKKKKANANFGKEVNSYKQISRQENVMLNPPTPECIIAFEGVEEFSGKKRKDVAPSLFFTYTSEKLRPFFQEKDLIKCTGHVSSLSGGIKFLSIEITVADERAQTNYGSLEKNSLLSIKLIDGTTIQLINKKTNQGTLNRFEKNVVYTAQYILSSDQEKALKSTEIDRVRVVWSTGFEEYEVFETDFMMHQLECLTK